MMGKNYRMDFQTGLPPKKTAGLHGMRCNISMNHQYSFAELHYPSQQIFKLPNLVAAINVGTPTVIFDPKSGTVSEFLTSDRRRESTEWDAREPVQGRDNRAKITRSINSRGIDCLSLAFCSRLAQMKKCPSNAAKTIDLCGIFVNLTSKSRGASEATVKQGNLGI
jgi:hypothetical protein